MSFKTAPIALVLAAASRFAAGSVYDFYLVSLDGAEVPLKTYQGKVLLVVNVASHTTYNDQLPQLEALHRAYAARGFAVLAIPSDDFGHGEPGKPEEVKAYYREKLHLTVPLFSKAGVAGKSQIPLYEFLTDAKLNAKTGGEVPWNFTKYLIGRDGKPVARFDAGTQPDNPELMAAVEDALARPDGVQQPISQLQPRAIIKVDGAPDWMAVTDEGVWVTSEPRNQVVFLDARTNKPSVIAAVAKPCSGLAAGFGAVWSPSCGDHALKRIDPATGNIVASVPVAPADPEGGIATGAGSVWMLTDAKGVLSRIDPRTNKVVAQIAVPDGSFAYTFADGAVWVTSTKHNLLARVDPKTNQVTAKVDVGPQPRFLTAGGGAVWTLNQGDGSISRVDTHSVSLAANIPAGVPGAGGEIAYGEGAVWVTMMEFPITKIDPSANRVVKQWTGPGGDSIRAALGSVWLTDLKLGKVMRFDASQL